VRAARVRRARQAVALALAAGLSLTLAADTRAREPRPPRTYSAHAVHIRDGDSLIVSDGERQRDLRIAEIDAPERGQPWGRRATQALTRLVAHQPLRVEFIETDRYGRDVSKIWAGDVCVACELVREGHAWAYRKYLRNRELLELERAARDARLGLWGQPAHTFVPPWEWRHGVRVVSEEAAAIAALSANTTSTAAETVAPACGAKRYCKEMSSCAEARFYLEQCGLARLDRDGDGVACEDLCF
jgi:endonuclease YncB( thermonuclease family)